VPGKIARRKELEKLMEATDFWSNPEKAKNVELGNLDTAV
jgi:hypothetical protein